MKDWIHKLKGDRVIWAVVGLLGIMSFLPVYSASSHLAYAKGSSNTLAFLLKHALQLIVGLYFMYRIHKIPIKHFKGLSIFALGLVYVLLVYTLFQKNDIEGANARRWILIPFVGISFQPSALAAIVIYVYTAFFISKKREVPLGTHLAIKKMWLPVMGALALIFPANLSTAGLIFIMVLVIAYVGNRPFKEIGIVLSGAAVGGLLFVALALAFPKLIPNRVDTWKSRIENYISHRHDKDPEHRRDSQQIDYAKRAIACGGLSGLGPGKSAQKNFLTQSSSDFIFAIIVEEYGFIGAMVVLSLYLVLLMRFAIHVKNAHDSFGQLLIVGLGFSIIVQALLNMGVAVDLLPVTGQTLPLISSGGSSIWMTCIALGIILSVTKKEEEFAQEANEQKAREEALEKLIEKQLREDEAARLAAASEGASINPTNI